MWTGENGLFHAYAWARLIGELATGTRDTVRVGQVPVSTDQKKHAGEFRIEGITRIDTHHQIWREVGPPGPCVLEIVLGVERIVSNEAAEDSTLQREPLAHGRKIGPICQAKVTQSSIATQIRRRCGEAEELRVFASLHGQLRPPA